MRRWLVRSAGFGILAAVAIWFTSEPIANLLWESDRLSGAELQSVVEVQRFAALFIPPFLVSMVFVRSFNAIGTNLPLLWVSLANIAVNVAGNYLLAPRFGLEGIMVSTALMYLSSGYLLRMAWRRTLRRA
jgi:peptidoglycan biosynthesis protein MviN/MurJ (putative lipid II flippase)